MKIDQLPFEILMGIFSYLKRCKEVLLVNKLFYYAACKVHDPKVHLTIDDSFFNEQLMSNVSFIIHSTRQISRLNIDSLGRTQEELRAVIEVIEKFSLTIKQLRFRMLRPVNVSVIIEILSLTPNVEQLSCENLRLRNDDQPSSMDKTSTDSDLNLRMLKKLRCDCCFDKLSTVFNRLPVRVITELDLRNFSFDTVTSTLLKRQTNIKKLKLTACGCGTPDILNNLTLEALELTYRSSDNAHLATLLSKQTKLRSLKLSLVEVDKTFINFLTNQFPELETISLTGPFFMPDNVSVARIFQLKKLKNVSLLFNFTVELDLIESLTESMNPRITELTISYGIYEFDLIQALAKTVPNLRTIHLDCHWYSIEADGFMRNFNFVEVFDIRGIVVVPVNDTEELTDGDYYNPRLEELIINGEFVNAERFLNKLIVSYPNLKKLKLKWKSITAWQVLKILGAFTELETLQLDGVVGFQPTRHFFNYVQNYKQNLKLITLDGVEIW